jgi:hypothetical protein
MEKPFIGAYWTARKEDRHECAGRIFSFIRGLSVEPLFEHWCLTGWNRRSSKKTLEVTIGGIERQLKAHYKDIPKEPIPDLGFNLSIWNGKEETPVGLMVTCGACTKAVDNAVVLNLPRQPPPSDAATVEWFHALVKKAVDAFDPEVAVATSIELNARGSGTVRENEAWIKYRRGQGAVFRTPMPRASG